MKDDINEISKRLETANDVEKKVKLMELIDSDLLLDSILEIIILYGKYIDTKRKIDIILNLQNTDNIIKYMTINELEIKAFLKEKPILCSIPGFREITKNVCYIKFKTFQNTKNVDLFYSYFSAFIRYDKEDIKYDNSIFNYISDKLLFSLVMKENDVNYDLIVDRCYQFLGHLPIDVLFYLYLQQYDNDKLDIESFISNEINERLGITPELIDFNQIDENYFKCLKYFSNIRKKERKTMPLYIKAYNLFLTHFINNFKDDLNQEDYIVMKRLFGRIINGSSLISILRIDNKKSLYHFYKTNDFIEEEKFRNSLEEIKNYNAKQYLNLKKIICGVDMNQYMYEPFYYRIKHKLEFMVDLDAIKLLEVFIYYGYDMLYTMRNELLKNLNILHNGIAYEIDDLKYKKMIKKFLPFFKSNSSISTKSIVNAFKIMYVEKKRISDEVHITEQNILNLATSSRLFLMPNNIQLTSYLEKLNLVKKGDIFLEKYRAAALYNKYKNRFLSSIPDVEGVYENLSYEMVGLQTEEILTNGIDSYVLPKGINVSCLTPNGKAATSLEHGATNVNGRFFKIYQNNKILCYSWVWRAGEVLCFDNIEVTKWLLQIPNYERLVYQIYYSVSKRLVEITNTNEKDGIKMVVIGRTDKDVSIEPIDLLKDTTIFNLEPFSPNSDKELYLEDSKYKQVVIYMKDIPNNTNDVQPIYKRIRKKIIHFDELTDSVIKRLKSIYFDYCIESCEKDEKKFDYVNGYIGDDWFIGIDKNDNKEFYYYGNDDRLFEETKKFGFERKAVNIIHNCKDMIMNIIESHEQVDDKLLNYLWNLQSEILTLPKEFYFHTVNYNCAYDLTPIINILADGEIRSFSKRQMENLTNGNNGNFFISVTKNNEELYTTLSKYSGFIINPNIMAFKAYADSPFNIVDDKFPCLRSGVDGEYHVFEQIPSDKFFSIQIELSKNLKELVPIGKIVYLMDYLDLNIPITLCDQQIIDKEKIKKFIKLK